MPSIQDEIYKSFAAVAGAQASSGGGVANLVGDLVAEFSKTQPGGTAQAQRRTQAPAVAGKSVAGTVESIATTVLKSGFGMAPLVSEVLGLFGGGGAPAPAPLVKYAMPPAIHFEAA